MRIIRLLVEYDGTAYCGWQIQPNGPTIQAKLEEAVQALTGETVRVEGSGRTDAGVHAFGQVAHFVTTSELPGEKFARALNAHLPKDISVREACDAPEGFHARFSATSKVYRYVIENAPTRPVIDRHHVWWISWTLDAEEMQTATRAIIGRHDFTSFTDAERKDEDNVRTVNRASWWRDGNRLVFEIEGEGFLYKMVRCLVGTLVEIGRGALDAEAMTTILKARSRSSAGPTAPPQGLRMVRVKYADDDGSDRA